MKLHNIKHSEKELKRLFKSRIDELMLQLPQELKTRNAEYLLTDYSVLIPNIPNEYKTREIANTLSHIESLLQDLEYYERTKRKHYYMDLIQALTDEMDEDLIDIDELKDREIFGNSFNNVCQNHLRNAYISDLISKGILPENYLTKTNINKKAKKDKKSKSKSSVNVSNNSNKNKFLGIKRRKPINSGNSEYNNKSLNCLSYKILKNTSTTHNSSSNKKRNKSKSTPKFNNIESNIDNSSLRNSNNNDLLLNSDIMNSKDIINRDNSMSISNNIVNSNINNSNDSNNEANRTILNSSKIQKSISKHNRKNENNNNAGILHSNLANNNIHKKVNNLFDFSLNEESREENSNNKRCYNCFSYLVPNDKNTCSVCKSCYHSYCQNLPSIKVEASNTQETKERVICNYCLNIIAYKKNKNEPDLNIISSITSKLSNSSALNSNTNDILNYNKGNNIESITPITENDIPNIIFKCQRLEDGFNMFKNNTSNSLFLKFTQEIVKEAINNNKEAIDNYNSELIIKLKEEKEEKERKEKEEMEKYNENINNITEEEGNNITENTYINNQSNIDISRYNEEDV